MRPRSGGQRKKRPSAAPGPDGTGSYFVAQAAGWAMGLRPGSLAVMALLVATLLPAAQPAPGGNPRAPLPTAADVLSLAMADDGTTVAGTADPGSEAPTPNNPGAAVTTWYAWTPGGAVLASGSADLPTCGTRLQDLCTSPVPAVAIASGGSRFALGADVVPSVPDTTLSVLWVGVPSTGLQNRRDLDADVVALAMSGSGNSVATLQSVPALAGGSPTTQVEWFDLGPTGAFTPAITKQAIASPPVAVALSDDGNRLAVAADKVYIYKRDGLIPSPTGTGAPLSIAIQGGGTHGLVWGTGNGEVAYATDGSAAPRGIDSLGGSVGAVAVSRDGKWAAAGNGAGALRVYSLKESGSPAIAKVKDLALGEPVRELRWSPDGAYLLARSATRVQLYLRTGNATAANVTALWSEAPAEAPVGAGLSASGDLAATGVGPGVVHYPVVHAIRADDLDASMLPGTSKLHTLTFRNDGNRPEAATLELWFPLGWFATMDRDNLTLGINGTATVTVRVIVPALQSAGTQSILVNHTLASTGGQGTSAIRVAVPHRDLALLDPVGPSSLPIRGGETVRFAARVENRGNRDVAGHLEVRSEPAGWRATVEPATVQVRPGQAANVSVALSAPAGIVEGDEGRAILVLLERPQEPVTFRATMGAHFEVALSMPATAVADAGNESTVEVTVRNRGNVPDTIAVEVVSAPEGWDAVFTPGNESVRDLPALTDSTVRLTVRVPAEAANGIKGTIVVRAASLADPSRTAQQQVLVTVIGHGGTDAPAADGGPDWVVVGLVAMAVLAVGGFVAGAFLLRRKD